MIWTEQHRVLTPYQLERVLELCDVFEGINGARSAAIRAGSGIRSGAAGLAARPFRRR